jgi:hypothetical protein
MDRRTGRITLLLERGPKSPVAQGRVLTGPS